MDAQSSVESHILLDVCEDSFEGIRGIGNVEIGMTEVGEEVGKIPLDAVVGTPGSAMCVVPSSCEFIRRAFLEECSPLVVPEFQPEDELRFADMGKVSHEGLQILSRLKLWPSRHVARDDHCLMELAHLHRHGKPLQQATSAVTDNGSDLPSVLLQSLNAVLVRGDGFVGEEP